MPQWLCVSAIYSCGARARRAGARRARARGQTLASTGWCGPGRPEDRTPHPAPHSATGATAPQSFLTPTIATSSHILLPLSGPISLPKNSTPQTPSLKPPLPHSAPLTRPPILWPPAPLCCRVRASPPPSLPSCACSVPARAPVVDGARRHLELPPPPRAPPRATARVAASSSSSCLNHTSWVFRYGGVTSGKLPRLALGRVWASYGPG